MENINIVETTKSKKEIQKDYMTELHKNPINKRSLWLNFIGFFIPIWGIVVGFSHLVKNPKRGKSLLLTCLVSFIFQGAFLAFCYMFLFDYLGRICITMFG